MEQDRMLQNPDERFPSLINLDAISIRAARYSGQKMDQQACCEDAIRALLRMEEKLKSMANIQEQALFAVFDFCSNCGIPAFPFIDKKNRCLYCTDTTRVTGARTCMNHEGILGCMQCCILTAWCRGKGMLAASGISSWDVTAAQRRRQETKCSHKCSQTGSSSQNKVQQKGNNCKCIGEGVWTNWPRADMERCNTENYQVRRH